MSEKEYYSISRIEEDFAILEFPDKSFQHILISHLPKGVCEGNILTRDENGNFALDFEEESRRKKRLLELQSKIFG